MRLVMECSLYALTKLRILDTIISGAAMAKQGMWDKGIIEGLPVGVTVRGKIGVGRHPGFVGYTVIGGPDKVLGNPYVFRWRPDIGQEKLLYYRPSNPRTSTQQAWRSIFADAIAAWRALSEEEKVEWNKKATRRGKRGTDIFRSWYLNTHRLTHEAFTVGTTVIGGYDYIIAGEPITIGIWIVGSHDYIIVGPPITIGKWQVGSIQYVTGP